MAGKINTNSVRFFEENPVSIPGNGSELILAAWKLSNPENIGKIIRLGHNAGALEVLFIQGEEKYRFSKIKKTAGFSFDQQKWRFIDEKEFVEYVLPGFPLTVLETCDGATDLFETHLPARTVLLAGSESHGLPEHIISKSESRVFIPMPGGCKSMNISNALSVASFEWLRQQKH